MGVFGLRLPEAEGGVGLGTAEAALVFAELGRRLVPGPLLWSHLAAGLVDGAASGERIVGGLEQGETPGAPLLVEHLSDLDVLLVLDREGVCRVDPRGLEARPVGTPLDPLTPLARVEALPAGERLGDAALAARLRREGAVLTAALLLGIAEECQTLATAYALEREQFNRPIGSFQAVKHILADAYVRQEQVRAATYAAAATLDGRGVDDADRAAAVAKLLAGELALKNARACIQVYGGMGYTWEMPPHYYLKRTFVLEQSFGTAAAHADDIAAGLGAA
jgi:alkylation response protein AidB-like acyl-CoA dehydrogenase